VPSEVLSQPVADRNAELRAAAGDTSGWRHRSATGALLRSCVLPELARACRDTRRSISLRVELLDPASELACREYREWTGSDSVPDARRLLEIEIYATVLAVCLERKRNRRLHPRIRFSPYFTARQLDLSDDWLIVTESGHEERAAIRVSTREQLYRRYEREFEDGWDQAKPTDLKLQAVDWAPLYDGEFIPRYNILNLYRELDLPTPEFTDGDLFAILERLNGDRTYSDDPSGGVDSA
jgi:hypothetical protein